MSKLTEDFDFIKHKIYNIDLIKNYLSGFVDEWFLDTSRQDIFETHKDTTSYFIYKANLDWQKNEIFSVSKETNDKNLLDLVEPIINDLEKIHQGQRGNVLFIKLKAMHGIREHKDSGDYLVYSRRNHIPIITSNKTIFGVGSKRINMQIGECWEINNTRTHLVENNSGTDRIHLLIDIMPNKEIG
jgi:hypothetical protein